MMDPSNINNFEDQWRKALQEASETPPPSVWESIEARLDGEQSKVVPLWWQSPKIWYAAASMAALLVVGGGLWMSDIKTNEKPQVAVSTESVRKSESKGSQMAEQVPSANESLNTEKLAANDQKTSSEAKTLIESKTPSVKSKGYQSIEQQIEIAASNNVNAAVKHENAFTKAKNSSQDQPGIAAVEGAQKPVAKSGSGNEIISTTATPVESVQPVEIATAKVAGNGNAAALADENQSISAQLLASLPYSDLDVYVQNRHIFFRPQIQIEEPVKEKKPKEYYAGLGVMPASFNPDVQLKEAPMAFSAQSVSQKRATTGSSQARASYAVQTQGGVRISKHWSVETGISYLRGNSAYEGGGYVLNAYSNLSSNVLENALAGLASSPSADKAAGFNNGALYIDVAKKVSNNYQYLQLPVQAGFTLNPDKKFSYSVLGGMMANFFLVNELESASGEIIRTTASDDIYRGMNWAATTGLRLNYKLSSNWGANLTGSYQRAVSSGFKSNQSLDSHPYLYGVSWSVRYSF
ncbi:Outer membrane protein beta-barrel domain-containing protein [Dyadobacter soli]|uniref:Outer membrane protein beta-barrel domain-containing protein n=1 Tax=Dyadobacter soli TaxID=659014 RepID=A0A1G7EPB2_9BACT|nr:anti-sigma factor [Dyadobacter soli]SDE65563.1 Outer membrane protein beta-barrel domain-containing protein [Dyadobacter soli]